VHLANSCAAFTSKDSALIKRLTLVLTLVTSGITAFCQVTVVGTVISKEDQSALPGVNVVEKGTENGTVTTNDGTFSLNVTDPNSILVFSFIGLVTQEVRLNGQINISIKMKLDCIKDFFDTNTIKLFARSGLINTPVGGQLEFSLPYFGKGTVNSGISYQTNLDKNHFLNGQIELNHFVWSCNFEMDAGWYYRAVNFGNSFDSRAYSLETKLNFGGPTFITGYSNLFINNIEINNQETSSGLLLGLSTWIQRPLGVLVTGKVALYKNNTEYFGQISRDSKHVNLFVRFYKLNSFTELSVGIGTKFYYRVKKRGK
jgi:hypothetical protein